MFVSSNTGKEITTVNTRKKTILLAVFALLLLVLSIAPVSACDYPGTGTPGYWKNHPEAWPANTIDPGLCVGCGTFHRDEAIAIMKTPGKGDKTYTMFNALVAALLNVGIGNPPDCILGTIDAAFAWMATNGCPGAGVKANSAAWQAGEPLYEMLDAYNNGELCAPHRD